MRRMVPLREEEVWAKMSFYEEGRMSKGRCEGVHDDGNGRSKSQSRQVGRDRCGVSEKLMKDEGKGTWTTFSMGLLVHSSCYSVN
jgi:hypothetical protein